MQWLAEVCVKRPVFATMIIMSLVVVGGFSFLSLGVDTYISREIALRPKHASDFFGGLLGSEFPVSDLL